MVTHSSRKPEDLGLVLGIASDSDDYFKWWLSVISRDGLVGLVSVWPDEILQPPYISFIIAFRSLEFNQ